MNFPKEKDFILPESIPSNSSIAQNIHKKAIEDCLEVEIPGCFLKYYQLLVYYFFKEKQYNYSIIVAKKLLNESHKHFLSKYPNSEGVGYLKNPMSDFLYEGFAVEYGGKSYEKLGKINNAIQFYEDYFHNGHWIQGIIQASDRLSILYKKMKNPKKAVQVLEYIIEKIELPEIQKISFQERINKLKELKEISKSSIEIKEINTPAKMPNPSDYPLSLSKKKYELSELAVASHLLISNKIVYKTENTFWWGIQSLLYYEEIFSNIPEQTFPGYKEINGMPLDFFDGTKFYERRKKLFEKKNKKLIKSNLVEEIFEKFYIYKSQNIRHLIIDDLTEEGLIKIVETIDPELIVLICDRINSNVIENRTGLPDLFVIDKNNNYKFVEVKKQKERIMPNQKLWLEFLNKIGIQSQIYRLT